MEKQPTIAEMRKALEASTSAMTPIEHFRRMVAKGWARSMARNGAFYRF